MSRLATFAGVCAVLAASATAVGDPTLGGVETRVVGGRLLVRVAATVDRKAQVRLEGTANGRAVRLRRPATPRTRSVEFVVDPRRLRLRGLTQPVVCDLTASVVQRGAAPLTAAVDAEIGVPCLLLPGLGNESAPGGFDLFAQAIDNARGGAYGVGGPAPTLAIHEYASVSETLPALAAGLDRAATRLLRGTAFAKVDVVGHSMGGLVARQWMSGAGRGRIRKLVFLGTPNQGAPLAYVLGTAAKTGALEGLLAGVGGEALAGFLPEPTPETLETLRLFYPTYDWASLRLFPPLPASKVSWKLLPDAATPLEALNAAAPDPAAEVHAFHYSSVPTEALGFPVGTMDEVDLSGLFTVGGGFDLTNVESLVALASGSGDGVVPSHSVTMAEVPAWSGSARFHARDLGPGTHVTFSIDPNVYAALDEVLGQE